MNGSPTPSPPNNSPRTLSLLLLLLLLLVLLWGCGAVGLHLLDRGHVHCFDAAFAST